MSLNDVLGRLLQCAVRHASRGRRLVLAAVCAAAFAGPAAAQQLALQRYGKAEGLANANVNCLVQGRDGFLWVCTENGVFRYDGHRFRRFGENEGLENTLVYSAVHDRTGRLWVATSSDLYVGEGGRFAPVRVPGRALGSASGARLALLEDGRIGAVVRGELLAIDGSAAQPRVSPFFSAEQLLEQPALAKLHGVMQAADGRLWLGCDDAICSIAAGRVRRWSRDDGVPGDQFIDFLGDSSGRVWARGRDAVLMRPEGGERFAEQPVPGVELHAMLQTAPLAESPDGSIVLRTHKGLARWRDGRWSAWTLVNGLLSPDVGAILFDREGSLWIGVSGQSLVRWVGYGSFESWTRAQGLDADVLWGMLRRPDGALMVGTRSACRRLLPKAAAFEDCGFGGLPEGEVSALAQQADGTLWIGMSHGELLALAPGAREARRVARLPSFTSMLVDSAQRLWVPTRGGVFVKRPDDAVPQRIGNDHEFLDAAEDAQGKVWVVGSEGILCHVDGGSFVRAPVSDRRAGPGFASIAIDRDGTLWAASRARGLVRARIEGTALAEAGWIDDPVVADAAPMFVRIDAARRVWVGTDYGVVVREPGVAGSGWTRLTESDGLVWNDVDQSSFHADADGSVWVGTSAGLSHILDPKRALSRPPLALEIVGARYAGRGLAVQGGERRPWSRSGALDIELASFSFSRSAESTFRYRIAGIDPDWVTSREPRAHYPALEPGAYRFEAMLFDPDRRQSSRVVGFDLVVQPPWWRSAPFYAVCLFAVLGGLALAWRWQVARLTARHAAEQQQARERHQLLERASRDALTGLWNRATILDLLAQMIERRPHGETLALAVLDVDHFKLINDRHGHAGGDAVLRELAQRVGRRLRQNDLLGRYGGEELLLVLPSLPCEAPAPAVERLREAVAEAPFEVEGASLSVTVSIGVAWYALPPGVDDTAARLFTRADAALYEAKRAGRNRVVCALAQEAPVARGETAVAGG